MYTQCRACGSDVVEKDKFCSNCGHKLNSIPVYIKKDEILKLLNDKYSLHENNDIGKNHKTTKMENEIVVLMKNDICEYGQKYDKCKYRYKNKACPKSISAMYRICPHYGNGFVDVFDTQLNEKKIH